MKRFPQFTEAQHKLMEDSNSVRLDPEHLDPAAVDVLPSGRIVYDYMTLVQCFAEHEDTGFSYAEEWMQYNTLRAIPYMPDPKPLIRGLDRED